jgi:steroid 5-alpha reductase family enzyme
LFAASSSKRLHVACAADFQKDRFKKKPENKGDFCSTGLFRLCQFPNYFGEIACWCAVSAAVSVVVYRMACARANM